MSQLRAADVVWTSAQTDWPSSSPILRLAVELLPEIEDDTTATLVEELSVLITDRDEQIAAIRELQSVALDELRQARLEVARLRKRVIELRESLRQRRTA